MKKAALFCAIIAGILRAQWPDTVLAMISTGQYPNDACFSPDGQYVFVAVGYGHLSRISTQTWSTNGVLPLDGTPECVTCLPDNTVLVADEEMNKLYFIDGEALTVIGETTVNSEPMEFASSADGSYAFLSHGDGFLSVIDPAAMEVVETVWVGNQPGGCHLTSDGQTLFVADTQSPSETAFTVPSGPVQRFVSGMDSFDCAVSEGSLYLSNPAWEMVQRMDAATLQVTGSLEIPGADPRWMAPIPGLPYMYVGSTADNTLRVVDTGSFQQAGAIQVGASPQRLQVSSNGAYLLVPCRGTGKLYVIGYDPEGVGEQAPETGIRATGPSAAPEVVVTIQSAESCTITLHDLSGRRVATLHSGTLNPGMHTFSCQGLPSGVYHALVTGGLEGSCRLTVIRSGPRPWFR